MTELILLLAVATAATTSYLAALMVLGSRPRRRKGI